jgi:hypothetical protein
MSTPDGSEMGAQIGAPALHFTPAIAGSESATEAGSPDLIFGPPSASIEFKVESTAALQRWDKPGYPSVYFFSKGFSCFGKSVEFPTNHSPGPEFVEVQPTGRLLEMGQFPAGRIFIRRDDPHADLAEVMP